jgi:hypothetical protein
MNRTFLFLSLALGAIGLAASRPATAAEPFAPVPGDGPAAKSPLLMRVVEYAGNSHGAITVEVKNPTQKPQEFSAKGIYFVPQGNADQAPQRLGAVGPFELQSANGPERREHMTIPAGATQRLTLDVYCIDSHRASPSSSTGFRVAKDRVPPALTKAIDEDAARSAQSLGGVSAPEAKPAIQSEVWKNRDRKWIKLDGEGKQELSKSQR